MRAFLLACLLWITCVGTAWPWGGEGIPPYIILGCDIIPLAVNRTAASLRGPVHRVRVYEVPIGQSAARPEEMDFEIAFDREGRSRSLRAPRGVGLGSDSELTYRYNHRGELASVEISDVHGPSEPKREMERPALPPEPLPKETWERQAALWEGGRGRRYTFLRSEDHAHINVYLSEAGTLPTDPSSRIATIATDSIGRWVSMEWLDGAEWLWTYDLRGRLTEERTNLWDGPTDPEATRGFDDDASMTAGNTIHRFAHNEQGELSEWFHEVVGKPGIKHYVAEYTYDERGNWETLRTWEIGEDLRRREVARYRSEIEYFPPE